MSNRENKRRVSYYDGQRITESDLDNDQNYFRGIISSNNVDRGDFGIIDKMQDADYTLLDIESISSTNPSFDIVKAGRFDGKIIRVDKQPLDPVYGDRIEVSLYGSKSMGRFSTKVMIIGKVFNDLSEVGSIEFEILDFKKNESRITKKYYSHIYSIVTNNYSGGTCSTEDGSLYENEINSLESSNIVIKSAKPMMVFADDDNFSQNISPSFYAYTFSHKYSDFSELVSESVGLNRSENEVYRDFSFEKETLGSGDNIGNGVGVKFLSNSNNIQSVNLLLSLADDSDWTGDIVFSIYELSSQTSSRVATDPIGFDPSSRPIAQVALDQQDFASRGVYLTQAPRVVSIDFSRFECSNPNSGRIQKNKFYCVFIERVGDNRENSINIYKGDYIPTGKSNLGVTLNPQEAFSKQNYKMFKYDAITEKYLDFSDQSLWFEIKQSCIEVTYGSAYSTDGFYLNIPKYQDYVGSTKVHFFKNNIDIPKFNEKLYVCLERSEEFLDLDIHPRTGNYVHTKIADRAEVEFFSPPIDIKSKLILASVNDENTRDKFSTEGTFSSAGLYETNHFFIVRPNSTEKLTNYIGMNFIPDSECDCSNEYQIVGLEKYKLRAGDLDRDGKYTLNDAEIISELSGNTLNSEETERRLFGGEIGIEDFYLADLNDDGAIDGFDILKAENAVNGDIDFESGIEIEFLKVFVENIVPSERKTLISGSGTTAAGTATLSFTSDNETDPLSVRVGDIVYLDSSEVQTELYVHSKYIGEDGVSVELGLVDSSGIEPSFLGSSANFSIVSKTRTNLFADNKKLLHTPYTFKNFRIFVDETEFRRFNINICDLRTFINFNTRKEADLSCLCEEQEICEIPPVVETNIVGDLKVHGKILGKDNLPYRSDFEYSSIKIPLPAGSIEGCSIDVYDAFVKASNNSCFTSAGLNALRYSDGTYVGCEDTETSNDIDKGRVKFLYGIASLFVDAESSESSVQTISESSSFQDFYEESFSEYEPFDYSAFLYQISSTSNARYTPSSNSLKLGITTSPSDEFSRSIIAGGSFTDDSIFDLSINPTSFPKTTSGFTRAFAKVHVTNDDLSEGIFEIGLESYSEGMRVFARTLNFSDSGAKVSDEYFYAKYENPDNLKVNFRVRRTSDSIKGYFFIDDDMTQGSVLGVYERVDKNPIKQIGYGEGKISVEVSSFASDQNLDFDIEVSDIILKSSYNTSQKEGTLTISKNASGDVKRFVSNVNIPISSRVVLQKAYLRLKSSESYDSSYEFRGLLQGLKLVNARNFETINNYFEPVSLSEQISVSGPVLEGEVLEFDITSFLDSVISERNFVSGISRGFAIEPRLVDFGGGSLSAESFSFESNASLVMLYQDSSDGVTYKVGVDLDYETGIMTFNTKNVLYDESVKENRTVVSVGVMLKKSGFMNKDSEIGMETIKSIGIGNCISKEDSIVSTSLCAAIAGESTAGVVVGSYVCGSYTPDPIRSSSGEPYFAVEVNSI